ncbi:hypothetical protein [uncultured Sphingomonas sp.]|uniref:hypothetical protein n=1 Tax=uncultured Sphingomonas sp. TaxID=158754 RepID=UPI00258DBED6|nr:hypothetical protein [uncultured Sphingomonas sp.]
MEGITAPARRATKPPPDLAPDPAPAPTALLPAPTPPRRADGWSAANQRLFLAAIAEGHGVDTACAQVGLSATSAYAFRRSAKGAAFALGWRAATLVARDVVADTLMVRALHGQVDTYTRADGVTVTRHRHDNRLAMTLLARLDRQVESAPDADVRAARLVAQEFDAFLDLVDGGGGPAQAGLFLARRHAGLGDLLDAAADDRAPAHDLAPLFALAAADRLARTGHATAQEVPVADLDPAQRASWTAEQWARAEAAGLLRLAPPPHDAPPPANGAPASQHSQHSPAPSPNAPPPPESAPVWWCDVADAWRTSFPPPPGFMGEEEGEPTHLDYERALTAQEAAAMGPGPDHRDAPAMAALAAARDAWFALAAPGARPGSGSLPGSLWEAGPPPAPAALPGDGG